MREPEKKEELPTTVNTGLRDLRDIPLAQVAADAKAGQANLEDALSRFAPRDGNPMLLVSAGFNSAI